MDSITHIVLGAAVGEILLGRKLGNKAMLLGAIGNTIPDLDVAINFLTDDTIRHLEVHRSYSHSMFVQIVLALPLAALSKRFDKHRISFRKWYLFWYIALVTHSLLDCCTTYGTQLLLPFTHYQVAFNNISVIDPFFTIPFLLLFSCCLFFKRENPTRRKFLYTSVIFCSLYLGSTFIIKYDVHSKFRKSLDAEQISYDELNSTPSILNAILWCGIAYDDSTIYTAEYSYFDHRKEIKWTAFSRNLDLLHEFDSPGLRTLVWFSDGNYFVRKSADDTLSFYNIKWGKMNFNQTEPDSAVVFFWKFYKDGEVIKNKQVREEFHFKRRFVQLVNRVEGI